MRRFTLLALLCVFPLVVGCAGFPNGPFAKSRVKTKHAASKRTADADAEDDDEKPLDKRMIVDEDEEHIQTDEEIFEENSKDRHKIKESDGLSSLMQGLVDPRTTEINRNLGYE